MSASIVLLGLLAHLASATRICSAWSKGDSGCTEFDVGLVSGTFDAQIQRQPVGSIFLYSHFATSHIDLLSHFVEHYVALGIHRDCVLLVWNVQPGDELVAIESAQLLFERLQVSVIRWTGVFTSAAAHYNKIKVLAALQEPSWVVYADIDEFLELSGTVQAQIADLSANNFTHQIGFTVDRVAAGGHLTRVALNKTISEQYPLRCNLTGAHGLATKVVLLRADLRTVSGNHMVHDDELYSRNRQLAPSRGVTRRASPQLLALSHYKWTHDVVPYLQRRIALYKQVQQYWALSYSLLASLQRNNWTINVSKYCRP